VEGRKRCTSLLNTPFAARNSAVRLDHRLIHVTRLFDCLTSYSPISTLNCDILARVWYSTGDGKLPASSTDTKGAGAGARSDSIPSSIVDPFTGVVRHLTSRFLLDRIPSSPFTDVRVGILNQSGLAFSPRQVISTANLASLTPEELRERVLKLSERRGELLKTVSVVFCRPLSAGVRSWVVPMLRCLLVCRKLSKRCVRRRLGCSFLLLAFPPVGRCCCRMAQLVL
jgi:hypothetical protein